MTLLSSCSTKKDAFVNRNWHALNTKYNVLYNGNLAFEEGREQLNESFRDNYWEILPVERLEVTDDLKLDSEDNNPNFERAEDKATKAIQKHSMEIGGEERNPQTDEAFILLGKARYFDQRYVPAIEAFNYVLQRYTDSDKLNEATIWREKTNIRLSNEELAIKNLKRLLKFERLKDQEYADARAMMAQAYINLNAPDTAIQQLKIATAYTKKQTEKGRYFFILGQLYNQLGHRDSANLAFDQIIRLNRSTPRIYWVNAHLQKLRNTEITDLNREELLEYLTWLEEDRENRPFLDKIYREIAVYYNTLDMDSLSLAYYNRSTGIGRNTPQLLALNYEDLAEYYFERSEYKSAGAYYDSVLPNLPENTKKYRSIRKKLDNLEDVITYEGTVQYADSVIAIYKMTPSERETYFQAYIDRLKAKAEAKIDEEEAKLDAGFAAFGASKGGKENRGKFYFYNITSLGYGKTEFKRRWGNRTLEDNWRWSNKASGQAIDIASTEVAEGEAVSGPLTEEQKYSLDYYLSQVPTELAVIDSLGKERNFANYQLGLIYKEKFRENLLASGKLENVLKSDPEERLILPSKYNLYKIYEEVGSPLAARMKENIIAGHPTSRYAEILLNPRAVLEASEDSPEGQYAALYDMFEKQEFLRVITGSEEAIGRFTGDPIVPKLEMLKATAIGRLQGFKEFKEALNYVALNYPNQAEGKKAQEMVSEQLTALEPNGFVSGVDGSGGNWKVVFPFKRNRDDEAVALMKRLEASLEDLRYPYKVSKDIYNLEDEFIVVHGFKSQDFALGYVELLKNNKDYRIRNENFVILAKNYKTVQIHKNLDDYRRLNLTPKP
jgi:tetratricopeptide (TPR) repeat protein